MRRSVLALAPLPDRAVDAFRIPGLAMAQRGVVHGDARCSAIAAASIIAKVTRDRLMADLHARDPRRLRLAQGLRDGGAPGRGCTVWLLERAPAYVQAALAL